MQTIILAFELQFILPGLKPLALFYFPELHNWTKVPAHFILVRHLTPQLHFSSALQPCGPDLTWDGVVRFTHVSDLPRRLLRADVLH